MLLLVVFLPEYSNTGMIQDFHLLYHFIHDKFSNRYLMVGIVGHENLEKLRALEAQMERQMMFEMDNDWIF